MFLSRSTLVKASEVNWLAWSVLKMSGLPYFSRASCTALMQNEVSMVIDNRHESTRRVPVQYASQIDKTFGQRDIGDVHGLSLVGSFHLKATQKVGIDLVARLRL